MVRKGRFKELSWDGRWAVADGRWSCLRQQLFASCGGGRQRWKLDITAGPRSFLASSSTSSSSSSQSSLARSTAHPTPPTSNCRPSATGCLSACARRPFSSDTRAAHFWPTRTTKWWHIKITITARDAQRALLYKQIRALWCLESLTPSHAAPHSSSAADTPALSRVSNVMPYHSPYCARFIFTSRNVCTSLVSQKIVFVCAVKCLYVCIDTSGMDFKYLSALL